MKVDLAAKLRGFDDFLAEYQPGDERGSFAGRPLIFAALSNNDPEARYRIASFLLDRDALVTGGTSEGDGALSILLSRTKQDVDETTTLVRRLLQAGADPAQRARRGVTPTQWLAQLPVDDADMQPLLELWFAQPGLDPAAPNDAGRSPIDLAGESPRRADRVRRMQAYRA